MRSGEVTRKTKETNIKTSVVVDGDGNSSVNTSVKFLLEVWNEEKNFSLLL